MLDRNPTHLGLEAPKPSQSTARQVDLNKISSNTKLINYQFNGRVFNQNGKCGAKGENCSMGEFNLDTGDQWTPQAYDLSNIQGFTQSMRLEVSGCQTVTCTNVSCGCSNAYPPGVSRVLYTFGLN